MSLLCDVKQNWQRYSTSRNVLTYFTEQCLLENLVEEDHDKHLASFTSRKLHKQLRLGRFSDLLPFRRLPIYVQTVAVETKVTKLTAAGTVPDSHGIPS